MAGSCCPALPVFAWGNLPAGCHKTTREPEGFRGFPGHLPTRDQNTCPWAVTEATVGGHHIFGTFNLQLVGFLQLELRYWKGEGVKR